MNKGISLASTCCLWNSAIDIVSHLFFHCIYARSLWKWLNRKIGTHNIPSLATDWFKVCNSNRSNQASINLKSAIVFILCHIWYSRNKLRHENLKHNCKNFVIKIMKPIKMVGNKFVNHSSIPIFYFVFINAFNVLVHPPRAHNTKEVIWSPPSRGLLKCNCDIAFNPDTNVCGCRGIFRNYHDTFLLASVDKLSTSSSVFAKLSTVLSAIDLAKDRGCSKLWIETDCIMVVKAFSNRSSVPPKFKKLLHSSHNKCRI